MRASASASATRTCLSQDAEELLRNADVAMYMAKRDSKGRYRLFEPAMHERVVERLELRGELQQALELEQLEVYYQPVVRLERGRRLRRRGASALAPPDARPDLSRRSSSRSPRRPA